MSMVLLDAQRGFARVVLGATAGAPLVLHQTAKSVLERRSEAEIGNALRDELRASAQDFTPGQLILHRTTVLRAIKDAQSG
jgi:carbon-monoxide dehydrogenase medium subunit